MDTQTHTQTDRHTNRGPASINNIDETLAIRRYLECVFYLVELIVLLFFFSSNFLNICRITVILYTCDCDDMRNSFQPSDMLKCAF